MDTKVNTNKSKRARLRRSRGILVSLCFVAAIVLAVGTGVFNQRTAEVQALSDAGQTTNFTEEVVEVNAAQKQEETLEIVSDQTYGEYEKGKVLLLVDDAADVEAVNAVLENTDFAETKNVSDQDISAGFVQVSINGDMAMGNALDTLAAAGLKAQPNYIYHPLEGEDLAAGAEGIAAAESADETLATEDAHEGSMEGIDPADFNDEVTVESATQQAPENDFNTITKLLTAASTGEGFVATDIDTAEAVKTNDPSAYQQWMLDSMRVYKAWGISKCREDNATSPKVSVAVIDTGCFIAHEDLVNNIKATYNSVSGGFGAEAVQDENGHGTHVAGIVSADANNGKGVAGVSYDAGLVIIKASFAKTETKNGTTTTTTGNFSTETLANAYAWLLAQESAGTQTNAEAKDVRVINMSLGGNAGTGPLSTDHVLYTNITRAKNQGILTVCAAGNDAYSGAYTCIPSDYEDCFTVINLSKNNSLDNKNDPSRLYAVSRNSGSNYNLEGTTSKNISAPGTSIYNTLNTGSYGEKTGTSMASPGVAGVAALMFAYDSNLSPDEARSILEQTATDLGAPGWDLETGYGEVDAYRALQILSAEISGKSILASDEKNVPLELFCTDGTALKAEEWNWTSSDPSVLTVDPDTGAVSAVGPGTATITATNKAITSRSITKDVSVGIDLRYVTVNLPSNETYTYNGSEHRPAVLSVTTADGDPLELGTDYRVAYSDNVNAGSGKITILPGENSTNVTYSKDVLFEIKPASITGINVPTIPDQTYTGNPVTPYGSILLDYGQTRLIRGIDYDVTFADNVTANLGLATATITGKGNYTGKLEANFNILRDFSKVKITVDDQEYTGSPITAPRIRATFNDDSLSGDAPGDYEIVSFENNIEPGTASVTLRGRGIYKATTQKINFTITKYDFKNGLDISPIPPQNYTGKEVRPTLKVSFRGKTLIAGQDYNVYYSNNIDSGKGAIARIVAHPTSKYFTGETTATFTINPQNFETKTSMDNFKDALDYKNGEILTQNIDLYLIDVNGNKKEKLEPGKHYRVWYRETGSTASVSPVGDAKKDKYYTMVIVGLDPYYSGTITREFKIKAPAPSNSGGNNSNSSTNNSSTNNNSSSNSNTATQSTPSAPTVAGTWKKSGGKWWFQLDSKSQSALKSSKNYPYNRWVTISGKRYYFDGAGWMKTNWLQWSNNWYWLGSDGAMKTGWIKTGGKWYYLLSSGVMHKGWLTQGTTKYYLNSSGAMLTGWQKINGTWYYFNGSGAMVKGWLKSGGKWYYLDTSSGAMRVNWLTVGGQTYFLLSPSGQMLTGWVGIDNVWYYFNGSGVMQKNKWIGNYYVDGNGKMLKSQWVGKYWVGSDGKWTGKTR